MKTNLIKALAVSIAMMAPAFAHAGDDTEQSTEIKLGYTAGNLGLNLGFPVRIILKGAIEFPAEQMDRYAGARITRLRVAMGNNLTEQNNYIFITDNLDGEMLYRQEVDRFEYGWNEITLDTPFEIDGRKLFVGFRYESAGETLSLDGEHDNNLANWLYLSQTDENGGQWAHQSGGALNIQAIVEGDNLPQHDIEINRHSIRQYACTGEAMPLWAVVRNLGARTVRDIDVTVCIDGREAISGTVDGLEIPSGEMANVCLGDISFSSNTICDLTAEVTAINGMPDEQPDNNTLAVSNIIVRKDYTVRKVMLEHFSTMNCANCPNAHTAIHDALRFRNDVIHVIHHAGFGVDPLTIPASETFLWLYTDGSGSGKCYAPAVMLDRTNMSGYGATDGNNSTPGPVFLPRRDNLGSLIDKRLSAPALITVDIADSYQPESRRLAVTVSGNVPNGSADRLGAADPRLTIMLIEDGIPGPQEGVTVPMDGPYVHDRVLRRVMTDNVWGDAVQFAADGSYTSKEYSMVIPEGWNVEKLSLVAFVSDFTPTSANSCQILNAAEMAVGEQSGMLPPVADATTTMWTPADENGEIRLPDGCLGARMFTLSGSTVASAVAGDSVLRTCGLPAGIYVISAETAGGTLTAKIIKR
ncbi:MAG: Omp28-related outer membrane protein [Muribaculaceae bacterium]|nr:Omp28-related outer membrane protein [Muribaculaceae bacterium]